MVVLEASMDSVVLQGADGVHRYTWQDLAETDPELHQEIQDLLCQCGFIPLPCTTCNKFYIPGRCGCNASWKDN